MYEEQFSKRLTELRTQKGVSARDMSLSIGQNPGYIRAIESGTAFPTMANFFYICEYFNITPQEFFNFGEETSNGKGVKPLHGNKFKCTVSGSFLASGWFTLELERVL